MMKSTRLKYMIRVLIRIKCGSAGSGIAMQLTIHEMKLTVPITWFKLAAVLEPELNQFSDTNVALVVLADIYLWLNIGGIELNLPAQQLTNSMTKLIYMIEGSK